MGVDYDVGSSVIINLTRLNESPVMVNASHIVLVESTPDTLITLLSGDKLRVRETPAEIQERMIQYLRQAGWVAMLAAPKEE